MRGFRLTTTLALILVGGLVGCGGPPRAQLRGTLVYADDVEIATLDLATGKRSVLAAKLPGGSNCAEGLSSGGSRLCFSRSEWSDWRSHIVWLDITTHREEHFGVGRFSMAPSDSGPVLWYEGRNGVRDSQSVLMVAARNSPATHQVISLGPRIRRTGQGADHWSYHVTAPVALDSGRIAFTGLDERIAVVDRSGWGKVSLRAQRGMPMCWRAGARKLVCRSPGYEVGAFQIGLGGRLKRTFPGWHMPTDGRRSARGTRFSSRRRRAGSGCSRRTTCSCWIAAAARSGSWPRMSSSWDRRCTSGDTKPNRLTAVAPGGQ